jgi:3-dehydroquinate synthetase
MVDLVVGGVTRVTVGHGVLDAQGILGDARPAACAVLIQPGAAVIGERVTGSLEEAGIRVVALGVPDGEAAKSLAVVEGICTQLATEGVTREDRVVAVGGGATTDLAGFVAAVYLRGLPAHFVPTTLLAAVDAAIGGKSGVDVAGKNLVGAFRHPDRVAIDLDLLGALPEALVREGLAEALKAGLVGDPGLFELIERDGIAADLDEVVARAIAVKARVVGRDFEDRGERAVLNYGHTVGHALEAATGISHGHAVAIGMVAAGRASAGAAGFEAEARQREAIARLGLPVSAPAVSRGAVVSLLDRDKKRTPDGMRMVLLEDVGRPVVRAVDSATVDAALAAVGIPGGDS